MAPTRLARVPTGRSCRPSPPARAGCRSCSAPTPKLRSRTCRSAKALERGGWLVGRLVGGGLVVETATLVRLAHNPYRMTTCRLPLEDLELWDRHFSAAG